MTRGIGLTTDTGKQHEFNWMGFYLWESGRGQVVQSKRTTVHSVNVLHTKKHYNDRVFKCVAFRVPLDVACTSP